VAPLPVMSGSLGSVRCLVLDPNHVYVSMCILFVVYLDRST
jgi:hypothetical protein